MKLIVAVDSQWNIGNDGDLLFHIPDDMKFFRAATINKVVIMGRKTLESFPNGSPLKNRVNIVLTKNTGFKKDGALTCNSVEQALEEVKKYNTDEVFIIGGEAIYEAFLSYCDTALVTHVEAVAPKADKKFPDLSKMPEWQLTNKSQTQECNGYKFSFCEYNRV